MEITSIINERANVFIKSITKLAFKNIKSLWFFKSFYMNFLKSVNLRRKYYEKEKLNIPLFLIASIASSCNLICEGCYAHANKICSDKNDSEEITADKWKDIFQEAETIGVSFILLAGGEPLTKYSVIEKASSVKKIIFPVFTNGTMFDEKYYKLFNNNRNLIPVISIEGGSKETDKRRGNGVYEKITEVMETLKKEGIIFGVSITLGKENMENILDKNFIKNLENMGVSFFIYVEYVDVAKSSITPIDEKERYILENKIDEYRKKSKSVFVTFPGDEKMFGGCLAAGKGFFHINSNGAAEPCPFSSYSDTSLKNKTLVEALKSPLFYKIRSSDVLNEEHKGGCVLFENEETVRELLKNK